MRGFLDDGYNSVKRYVYNNFMDYERQNIYDFLTNNLEIKNHKNYKWNEGYLILK